MSNQTKVESFEELIGEIVVASAKMRSAELDYANCGRTEWDRRKIDSCDAELNELVAKAVTRYRHSLLA